MISIHYKMQLQTPEWEAKRQVILDRDNNTCQKCNDKSDILHIHHIAYIPGRKAWEYENDNFITLCQFCHLEIERLKHSFDIKDIEIHKIIDTNYNRTILFVRHGSIIDLRLYDSNAIFYLEYIFASNDISAIMRMIINTAK